MPYAKVKRALLALPIRTRLTVQYTLSLAAAILFYAVLVSALLYWNVARLIDRELAADAAQIQDLPGFTPVDLYSEQSTLNTLTEIISPDTLVQLIDLNGLPVSWSDNLGIRPFPISGEILPQVVAGQLVYESVERREMWLRTLVVPLNQNDEVVGFLWLARSMHTLGETLDLLQIILTLAGMLTVGLVAFSGWRLARNALAPVDSTTQVALDISHSPSLERRVAYDGPPDEVGRMIYAFNQVLDRLQTARGQIEHTLAAQRRFVSDASHELRTPLTSLRGNVGVLRHMFGPKDDTAEILADMDDELARLSRLVNNLLALARTDIAPTQPQIHLNLSELVIRLCRQPQLAPAHIELHTQITAEAWILGEADSISQLLLILLDNAFSYTPQTGKVVVCVQLHDDSVILSVRDFGIGILPEDIPHIFDRFFRGQTARQIKSDGSGLGLAIASVIALQHSAHMNVTSSPGEGTAITVIFPAAR